MKEFKVVNSDDNGEGSLRKAFDDSNAAVDYNICRIIITKKVVNPIILSTGGIKVLKNIVLQSKAKKDVEIIGGNDDRIFNVCSDIFKIIGKKSKISLSGGKASKGGAIYSSAAELYLEKVILCRNKADFGGAIYSKGKLLTHNCSFENNSAFHQGGALWLSAGATLSKTSIKFNEVKQISGSAGGGGIFKDDGILILTNKTCVDSNTVAYIESTCIPVDHAGPVPREQGSGGGIVSMAGDTYIQNNSSVSFNTAYNSAGVLVGVGNITLNDSRIEDNEGFTPLDAAGGSGITISLGNVIISRSSISRNIGKGMYSSGIVSLIGDVIISNKSVIRECVCQGPGGAIACNFNGSIFISGKSKITKNRSSSLGGGIVNFSLDLGLISVTGGSSITDNVLTNQQTIGQTIRSFIRVILEQQDLVKSQAELSGGSGAAKFLSKLDYIKSTGLEIQTQLNSIEDKYLIDAIGGGGIAGFLTAPIVVDGKSIISGNVQVNITDKDMDAKEDGSKSERIIGLGGGIFSFLNTLNVSNSTVKLNKAQSSGGGIYIHSGEALISDTIVVENSVSSNTSGSKGGGISNYSKNLILSNIVVELNTADTHPNIYSKYPYTTFE